nr:MAG TPA: hypothetical protein [Caudoviricetes sp.]
MGFKAPTAKAADYICVNSRCLYPQQVLRFTVIWTIAEVLGCRPGLRQFLQGLMGLVSSYIFGFRAFTMFNLHWA